jgi:hypothetical protein
MPSPPNRKLIANQMERQNKRNLLPLKYQPASAPRRLLNPLTLPLQASFKNQQKVKAISPDNLKKSAIHHFPAAMTYSSNVVTAPGKSKRLAEKSAALRRTNVITQDDDIDNIREEDNDEPPRYNLPRTVLTYGTVKSNVMRRYVLEDVLQSEVDDALLILVSPKHINYISFRSIADLAPPLPLRYHRGVPFVQIKATVF